MDLFYVYLVFFVKLTIEKTVAQPPSSLLSIDPESWVDESGKSIEFNCTAPNATNITWRRSGNEPLQASATQKNGILIIDDSTPSDSGLYVCTATTSGGVEMRENVLVTVHNSTETIPPTDEGEPTMPKRCAPGEFQCRNRNCIEKDRQCNGYNECGDDSNVENCSEQGPNLKVYPDDLVIMESREVVFQCRDEGPIRARVHWMREDGAPLPPGSNDVNGRLEMPNLQVAHSGNYVCEALGVLENTPLRRVVAHLTVIKKVLTPRPLEICQFDEATCSNGDCIPKSKVCDGRYDCTDGTDEIRCAEHGCEPNQFRCANMECVSKVWRCDGDKDCNDGSDEENCPPPPPGSPCKYNEYQCARNDQCILKSFHCDGQRDCSDGSDEMDCTKVEILIPPPRMVILNVGETFTTTCTALGIPIPEISWRFKWGHVPEKCTTTSSNGTGTLTCPNIAIEDQGPYSCEGINTLGWQFAVPDTILKVESSNASACSRGTFNSVARTANECISCFCSGAATECSSANLFTDQLPAVFDQYNVVSVDTYPKIRIQEQASENAPEVRPVAYNGVQVNHRHADSGNPDNVLYFALPKSYHGSQLRSYGGYLKYTVRYAGRGSPNSAPDVIISGNNYVLIHKGGVVSPNYETEKSVRFFFGNWTRKQGRDDVTASREEIMMTLANVDNILIKVKYDDGPINTTISNVFMDTADVRNTDQGAATYVEECRCPVGYTGLSCEHCAFGWTGWNCSQQDIPRTTEGPITELPPARINVTIRENPIEIVEAGSTVTYHCAGRSEDNWRKESGQLPPGRSYDDSRGILIIRDVTVSDSGIYICQVSDGINNPSFQWLSLLVRTKPTAVIEPPYLTVVEGNPAEFRCVGSGNPQPQTSWVRVEGEMNPTAVFDDGIWRLSAARKSDEAEYKCIVENSVGTSEIKTILYVIESPVAPPGPKPPTVNPLEWIGGPTDILRLFCSAPRNARITWSRSENVPLPASAFERDGVLTLYNLTSADSGYYVCTSIPYQGVESSSTTRVIIRDVSIGQPPIVRIEPDRQTVSQGTLAEVKCIATGEPTPTITWTKIGGPLDAHIQTVGNTLRIINSQVSDRGIYVCRANSSGGNSQGSAVIEVERRAAPVIELYPEKNRIVPIGRPALLQCHAIEGVPVPSISWARQDGKPFSTNVEQLPGGVLRFTQVTMEDGGSFVCSASNEVGSTSMIAVLEISSPPVITITPSNRSPLTVRLGERVRLTCSASGQPNPSVSWFKQRNIIPGSAYTPSALSSTAVYEISSISYDDEGSYTCIATNAYGRVEERIQIRIEDSWPGPESPAPNSGVPDDNLQIPDGGRVEMRCPLHGNDQEAIYLDWKRNDGRNLPQGNDLQLDSLALV